MLMSVVGYSLMVASGNGEDSPLFFFPGWRFRGRFPA